MAQHMPQLDLMGISITMFTSYRDAENRIIERIRSRQKTFCAAINPEKIYRAQTEPALKELLNSADIHLCDGIGAKMAIRILHGKKVVRITGVQLFFNLIARAEAEGLRVFLLGASLTSNEGAFHTLRRMYPTLKIAGRQDGYFKDDSEVIRRINESGTDMLFAAMGSPRQEQWIAEYRDVIEAPFCMGVGGTFDVVSGNARWAPRFFRKTGTEFLYRLICDPRRIKRQIVLPMFAIKVLSAKLKRD